MSNNEETDPKPPSANPSATGTEKCVHAVSVKLPDFIIKDPELWLIQAKSQFKLGQVTNAETQYHHIVSRLPPEVLLACRDIIKEEYRNGSLDLLTNALVKRFAQSDEQRIRDVLDNIQYSPPV